MHKIVAGLGAGIGFVALIMVFMWLQGGSDSANPGKTKPFTHMHCPECALEMPYSAPQASKPCPQCGPQGARLIPSVGPYSASEAHGHVGMVGKLMVALALAVPLYGGLLYFAIMRQRARLAAAEAAQRRQVICHCPFCQRKLGFPASLIGAGVVCRRCKTAFTLPEGEPSEQSELA